MTVTSRRLPVLPRPVTALDSKKRRASKGGVGAKKHSPDLSAALSCRATKRERYLGLRSSPLLTSTHLTKMGLCPVLLFASLYGRFLQTPFVAK